MENNSLRLRRIKYFKTIAFIGIILFLGYAGVNVYIKDYKVAVFEFLLALTLGIALILLNFKEREKLSLILGVIVLLFITLYNFLTGGFDATGIFWVFMFPPIIFTLRGSRLGGYWFFTCLFFLILIGLGDYFSFFVIPYDPYTVFMFVLIFSIVCVLNFTNQYTQEKYQEIINEQTEEINKKNEELKKEVVTSKKILEKAEKKTKDLERLNQLMIGRELKMMELKKELNKLRKK